MNIRRLFSFNKRKNSESIYEDSLLQTIKQIKDGDKTVRNDFISSYKPFILKITSKITGKYIDTENCDEFSIGMSAFNEAIDKFDTEKTGNFLLFAQTSIERRIIDYLRKSGRNREYPFTYFEGNNEVQFEEKYFLSDSNIQFEDIESKDEIDAFMRKLEEFGISFEDLWLNTPKHKDSRKLCFKIATVMAEDDHLYNSLNKCKSIPRNDLIKKIRVHGKTIGNNRKYIIALCLIMRSNLELSKSYLKYMKEEGR